MAIQLLVEQEKEINQKEAEEIENFDTEKFEQNIQKTIETYNLFTKKDKVLVACSGGKDSTVTLFILKKLGYNVEAITVDAHIGCYTKDNLERLRKLCTDIGVKLYEVPFREKVGKSLCYIQSVLKSKGHYFKSCHTCGVLRRYLLNMEARKIQPDVIVTGHNMDDEAQSTLMNLFRNNMEVAARLGPKTGLKEDSKFVPRAKPLYFTREKDVILYSKAKEFHVKYGACPCSVDSYRREVRNIFSFIEGKYPDAQEKIISSFMKMLPKLRKQYSTMDEIKHCEKCGEPSSRDICNTCSLLDKIRS